jgi:hypothetical protein
MLEHFSCGGISVCRSFDVDEKDTIFAADMFVCSYGTGYSDRIYVLFACEHSSHMVSGSVSKSAFL